MNLVDLDHTSCAMTATQFVLRINKVYLAFIRFVLAK